MIKKIEDESNIEPTEKVFKIGKNIIDLMKLPPNSSNVVSEGVMIYYESKDKTREVQISTTNNNSDYPAILYSIKNYKIYTSELFSFHDIPHIKRFLEGYKEEDVYSNFYPKSYIWLNDIYTFVSENKDEEAMDLMFTKIGDLLNNGDFEVVNEILPTIDLKKLNLNLLVGLLCITRCGTNKPSDFLASYYEPSLLPYRPKLVEEIEKVMYEIEPTERIDKLLEGLRR